MKKIIACISLLLLLIGMTGCHNKMSAEDFAEALIERIIYEDKSQKLEDQVTSADHFIGAAEELKQEQVMAEVLQSVGYQLNYTEAEMKQIKADVQQAVSEKTSFKIKSVKKVEEQQVVVYEIKGLDYEGLLKKLQNAVYQEFKAETILSEEAAKKIVLEALHSAFEEAEQATETREIEVVLTGKDKRWAISDSDKAERQLYQAFYFNEKVKAQ